MARGQQPLSSLGALFGSLSSPRGLLLFLLFIFLAGCSTRELADGERELRRDLTRQCVSTTQNDAVGVANCGTACVTQLRAIRDRADGHFVNERSAPLLALALSLVLAALWVWLLSRWDHSSNANNFGARSGPFMISVLLRFWPFLPRWWWAARPGVARSTLRDVRWADKALRVMEQLGQHVRHEAGGGPTTFGAITCADALTRFKSSPVRYRTIAANVAQYRGFDRPFSVVTLNPTGAYPEAFVREVREDGGRVDDLVNLLTRHGVPYGASVRQDPPEHHPELYHSNTILMAAGRGNHFRPGSTGGSASSR